MDCQVRNVLDALLVTFVLFFFAFELVALVITTVLVARKLNAWFEKEVRNLFLSR